VLTTGVRHTRVTQVPLLGLATQLVVASAGGRVKEHARRQVDELQLALGAPAISLDPIGVEPKGQAPVGGADFERRGGGRDTENPIQVELRFEESDVHLRARQRSCSVVPKSMTFAPARKKVGLVEAPKLLPQEAGPMLHDVDELLAVVFLERPVGRDRDQQARLLHAPRPIGRDLLPARKGVAPDQFGPIESLAMGELLKVVHDADEQDNILFVSFVFQFSVSVQGREKSIIWKTLAAPPRSSDAVALPK